MTPGRGRLLVRPVETPPTITGGSIILTETTRGDWTWGQMEVIEVGAPAYCNGIEDCDRPHFNQCHYNQCSRGDWVLIKPRSASETHQAGLYVCNQDDVLAILEQ